MKKQGILHPELSRAIASLGHMDTLVIADAGLPIPTGPMRIDLALTEGVPGFLETLRAVLDEMQVEGAIIAEEMAQRSPALRKLVLELLAGVPMEEIPHAEFKQRTETARAIVRTGEFTPYANIILMAGVVF